MTIATRKKNGSGIEPLGSKMGVYFRNSHFELLSFGIELIPTLLKTYMYCTVKLLVPLMTANTSESPAHV